MQKIIGPLTISLPKKMGGWGIKDPAWFNTTFCIKSFWRGIFGDTLRSVVLHIKYLRGMSVKNWLREQKWRSSSRSFLEKF